MFFSDWEAANGEPGLERAYMDGSNRYGIVRSKLAGRLGLPIESLRFGPRRFEQICVLSHRSDNGGLGYRCKCRMASTFTPTGRDASVREAR
ncbi:unnamed protein product [Arctogadus glacialis]